MRAPSPVRRYAATLAVTALALLPALVVASAATPPSEIHTAWDALLRAHVRDGRVDYVAMRAERARLDAYLERLRSVGREELAAWPRPSRIAFWINAYNASTVALVLDHYPIDGIWNVTPFWKRAFGGPFAIRFIPLGHLAPDLGRQQVSLSDIEHEILRAKYDEPRIHVGLVCASKGCPALRAQAYVGADLDDQLDDAFAEFMRDTAKNRYDKRTNTLYVSKIFDWFEEDFRPGRGPVGYMERYGPETARRALSTAQSAPRIAYTELRLGSQRERVGRGRGPHPLAPELRGSGMRPAPPATRNKPEEIIAS